MESKLYPYKTINNDNGYYIFTSKRNRLLRITEENYKLLKSIEKKQFVFDTESSELAELYATLKEYELVDETKEKEDIDTGEIYSLVLMIAQDCNLNCKYCYGSGGEYRHRGKMSLETAKKAFDFLIQNCGTRKNVYVTFFGGEPLLNQEVIFGLIEYMEEVEKVTGIRVGRSMTTNGTLLTEEISQYCLEKHIDIKISIDGPEHINDQMRVYKDGRGSYKDIIEKTEKNREKKMVSARATITPLCIDREYIQKTLEELGFINVGTAFADELFAEEDYFRVYKQYAEGFSQIKLLIEREEYSKIRTLNIRAWGYLYAIHKSEIGKYSCGTGRNLYAVDIAGDIYPCHRFVGNESYRLGNIFSGVKKRQAFLDKIGIDSKQREKCQNCWIKNLCIGMCPYTYFVALGEETTKLNTVCILNKTIYEDAINLYLTLTEQQKEKMFVQ